MAKRIVLVAFVAAAIGLCAWILRLGAPTSPQAVSAQARPEGVPSQPERDAGMPVPIRAEGTESRTTPLPAKTGAGVGEPAAAGRVELPSAALAEGGIAVRIVGPQGQPLEGAQVLVLAEADAETLERFWDPAQVDALMESAAPARVTDASGTLQVPAPRKGRTLILGRRGKLWGSRSLAHKAEREEPVELELLPDVTLRARVVDPDGVPVSGVGVQFLQKHAWGAWPVFEALTQGDPPIATLRHAQDSIDDDADYAWALGLDVLFQTGIEYALDPSALPQEIVTLVLPATGSVEVAVYGDDRQPFVGEAQARVGIVREGEPDRLSPFSDIQRATVERPVVEGIARFPHVEPGQRLAVAVSRDGSRVATRTFGPGPDAAGQSRTLELVLGSDHPVVLLRAVDEEGRPLANVDLEVRVLTGTRFSSQSDDVGVHTDAEGAFLVDIEHAGGPEAGCELIVSRAADEGASISGRVDASARLRHGVNDLGVVRLEPPPLFVAGRVVSASGEGLADVRLVLQKRSTGKSQWSRDSKFDQRSGEAGEFRIRGIHAGDELRIGASLKGRAGSLQEFRRGDDGVLIELDAEGVLEGSVLLDEDFPRDVLKLSLTGEVDHLDYSQRNRTLAEDGSFRFAGLLRGEYGLRVRIDGHRDGVEEFAGIPLMAGQTTRDPRLDPLDLRARFHAHRVTLVLPEDAQDPGLSGKASFGPVGVPEPEATRWFHEAEFWVVAEHERIDLEVHGTGYLAERLADVAGEIRIALRPSPSVRLALAADAPLPEPPVYIKATLTPTDGSHGAIDWAAATFDERREIVVRVPSTGEMKVTWVIEHRGSGSSTASSKTLEPPQLVTVTGEPGERIEVSLTAEQLEELVGDD